MSDSEYPNTICSRMDGGEGRGALALRSPALPTSVREETRLVDDLPAIPGKPG
jgi:hypothetical protein